MTRWTQADLDKLRAAILALSCGEAVQSVRYDGPPARQVVYQPADLDKMRKLEAEMERDVARAAGGRTYTLLGSRKGV